MTDSCQFHSVPPTPQNLGFSTQNLNNSNPIDTLVDDVFRTIMNDIGVSDIGQVFKCCLVNSDWKRKIEDYTEIFEKAGGSLNLKIVEEKQAKSAVFDKIKELKAMAEMGGQELIVLAQKLPTIKKNQRLTNEEDSRNIRKVLDGLKANLCLLNVGQSTWDNVKNYLLILISLKKKTKYLSPDLIEVVFTALREAAKRHLFDDVLTFFKQIDWNLGWSDYNFGTAKLHELLFHFYINDRFEQAQTLFQMSNLESEEIYNSVYKLCKLFHERNEVDKAKLAASQLLSLIAEMALKEIKDGDEDDGLFSLMMVFKSHILNGEFQKVKAYLSTNPEFAQKILDADYDVINTSTKSFLEEFVHNMIK